ncbi:MAG: J domain-containing protein [Alphaproteobacteria bacterium]|nr:J domain-containing protein [Alphaproteobacteria bacterium]
MFDAKDYKAGTSAATNSKDVLRKWGISENSKPEDIKKRYRELSAIFHPDKVGGSNEVMQIINAENEILIKSGLTK